VPGSCCTKGGQRADVSLAANDEPPNAVFASLALEVLGFGIGFGQWMLVGAPLILVAVTICWAYLIYLVAPVQGVSSLAEGNKVVDARLRERGPLSRDELLVSVVFLLTVVAWVSRSLVWRDILPNVNNTAIAPMGALTLFLLPSGGKIGHRSGANVIDTLRE
jgi:solute carrier family 13 (sodium-dependent dicarboxylate transporter), member 2/3/5